jgi:hypothetical protein
MWCSTDDVIASSEAIESRLMAELLKSYVTNWLQLQFMFMGSLRTVSDLSKGHVNGSVHWMLLLCAELQSAGAAGSSHHLHQQTLYVTVFKKRH